MIVGARRAHAADAGQLDALRARAVEAVAGQRSGPLFLRAEGARDTGSGDGHGADLLAVAEIDGAVVGFLEAVLVPVGSDGARLCRVTAVYVEPDAREVGAGEALMELVTSWARETGVVGIDALALPGARELKNFFESAGFAARLIVMHHRLDAN